MIDPGTGMVPPEKKEEIEKDILADIPRFDEAATASHTSEEVSEMMTMHATWLGHRLAEIKAGVEEVKNLLTEFLNEKISK